MRKFRPILLSAGLSILSYPLAYYSPNLVPAWLSAIVAWFMYVPLAISVRESSPKESFKMGYLFGLLSRGGILFWIIIAMQKYGGLSFLTSGSIFLLLILYLALIPAVGFWLTAKFRGFGPSWLLASVIFTLLECTLVYFPLEGYPWTAPAYSLFGARWLIQSADIIGTEGLNLILFLVNFALAEAWVSPPFRKWAIGLVIVLLGSSALYGEMQLRHFEQAPEHAQTIRIALLQGNIPQDLKWDRQSRDMIIKTYAGMTDEAEKVGAQLIVWPEAAYPYSIPHDTQQLFPSQTTGRKADVIVGAATFHFKSNHRYFQNSAFVVRPDGSIRTRYDKQHLVPFGEYVPLEDILPMHYIVPAVAGNFSKGERPELSETNGKQYGILICYEIIFPDLTLDLVRRGAHFLVNITNDAWFDETSGPYQHLRYGALRAIETRRPIVRAANTGVTAWFDSTGAIHNPTKLFTSAVLIADISPNDEITFYVRYPYFTPLLAALAFLSCIAACIARKRKKSS